MRRAIYDKQFKMAAVKRAQSVSQPVRDVVRNPGISGTRRIQLVPEKQGIQVNCKRISRWMSEHGFIAIRLSSPHGIRQLGENIPKKG